VSETNHGIYMGTIGFWTGLLDRDGQPVHIGDTLEFDLNEWGGDCVFVIGFDKGELTTNGTVSDISEWCRVIKKWNVT